MDPSPEASDCVFCKILSGEAPARILYRDDRATAFRDIHPIARTHILVIPNRHIASVNELIPGDENLVGHLFMVARELALQEGVADAGYRLIVNTGADSGQTVPHLHLHLIAGKFSRFVIK
ncbi:MAG TPA: histidine triad nucleotide-binding protein [Anaerolineales bacterium]|nr:histidine triad nucleotide-binding protein [Anaerolineales bacterium]